MMETYLFWIVVLLLGISASVGVIGLSLRRQLREVNHNLFQIAFMLDHW